MVPASSWPPTRNVGGVDCGPVAGLLYARAINSLSDSLRYIVLVWTLKIQAQISESRVVDHSALAKAEILRVSLAACAIAPHGCSTKWRRLTL